MTLQVWGAVLLVGLALLLGAAWTFLFIRRQAEERRTLNKALSAVCPASQRRRECLHCASPLSKRDCYFARRIVEQPDDD